MSQIYQYYNPLNSGNGLFQAMKGKDRRMMDDAPYNYKNVLKMKSGIGRKDEQIFLDWFPSEERAATFMPSVR